MAGRVYIQRAWPNLENYGPHVPSTSVLALAAWVLVVSIVVGGEERRTTAVLVVACLGTIGPFLLQMADFDPILRGVRHTENKINWVKPTRDVVEGLLTRNALDGNFKAVAKRLPSLLNADEITSVTLLVDEVMKLLTELREVYYYNSLRTMVPCENIMVKSNTGHELKLVGSSDHILANLLTTGTRENFHGLARTKFDTFPFMNQPTPMRLNDIDVQLNIRTGELAVSKVEFTMEEGSVYHFAATCQTFESIIDLSEFCLAARGSDSKYGRPYYKLRHEKPDSLRLADS